MTSITSLPGSANLNSTLGLDTNGDGIISAEELAASQEKTTRTQDPTVLIESAATGVTSQVTQLNVAQLLGSDGESQSDDETVSLLDVLDQIAVIVDKYRSLAETEGAGEDSISVNI